MKKSLFGSFSHAFAGTARFQGQIGPTHPAPEAGHSIPVEVVQAADSVLDIFSMYKLLGADGRNAAYWPERRTLIPDGRAILRPTAVVSLYHATLQEFADYKIASDRGENPDAVAAFRDDTDKLEVRISKKDDELTFGIERHCCGKTYHPKCAANDDVMLAVMGFVREASPALSAQISFLERAWLKFPDDGIALNF